MKEIEIKFEVKNIRTFRSKLKKAKAKLAVPRHFEDNWIFDTEDDKHWKNNCMIRLRKANKTLLTFKGNLEFDRAKDELYREADEHEIEVSDFDTAVKILELLGFKRKKIYQKYREIWKLNNTKICIDELPFGKYIEIEGSKANIEKTIKCLGFDSTARLTKTYQEIWKKFDKFKGKDIIFK